MVFEVRNQTYINFLTNGTWKFSNRVLREKDSIDHAKWINKRLLNITTRVKAIKPSNFEQN